MLNLLIKSPVSTLSDELDLAAIVMDRSIETIVKIFDEARKGGVINLEAAVFTVKEITASVLRNPGALIGIARIKTKDNYTHIHSIAVSAMMISLAKQLKLSDEECSGCGLGGLLHDIGKMAIPSDILNKPCKLTDAEFDVMRNHPMVGYKMLLEGGKVCEIALDVCLNHHEKIDGSGYPNHLSGSAISQYARMGMVCDIYDAITSNRSYSDGWCPSESLRQLAEMKGYFDPDIFQSFVKCMGIYPVGTLVRLKSGRLGVVVEQSLGKLLLPKVKVFYYIHSHSYLIPKILDFSDPKNADSIVGRVNPAKWKLNDIDRYWLGDRLIL